ncbi:ArsR family transcriptional regulator [Arthrobacter sp. SIMBA_036]|uniref:ArsR family transcriptional regulator n=1 Tax=Arthrobacter sp. SIMBA_036 TaxID=3085778 RepID=UPI00397E29BA
MIRTRSQILRFLIRTGPAHSSTLSSELLVSPATLRRHLLLLESAGYIQSLSDERFSPRTSLIECVLMDIAAQYSVQSPHTIARDSSEVARST